MNDIDMIWLSLSHGVLFECSWSTKCFGRNVVQRYEWAPLKECRQNHLPSTRLVHLVDSEIEAVVEHCRCLYGRKWITIASCNLVAWHVLCLSYCQPVKSFDNDSSSRGDLCTWHGKENDFQHFLGSQNNSSETRWFDQWHGSGCFHWVHFKMKSEIWYGKGLNWWNTCGWMDDNVAVAAW